jgi:hypothetical protein
MEMADIERMESLAKRRVMTGTQRSARLRELENMKVIRQMKTEPRDPERIAAGLAQARAALAEAERDGR